MGAIAGPITVVDSTMATPLIQRPLDYGVDLVVHSATFELAGGYDAACTFVEALQLARLAPSLGGPETLVNHPASMTHAQLEPAERAAIGIGEGMIRLSMGLEHPDDVTADIWGALST